LESNDDDDVVEVEEDGAVKTEQGEDKTYDYSNDGTDVRCCTFVTYLSHQTLEFEEEDEGKKDLCGSGYI
jgi:hypothetical protein